MTSFISLMLMHGAASIAKLSLGGNAAAHSFAEVFCVDLALFGPAAQKICVSMLFFSLGSDLRISRLVTRDRAVAALFARPPPVSCS